MANSYTPQERRRNAFRRGFILGTIVGVLQAILFAIGAWPIAATPVFVGLLGLFANAVVYMLFFGMIGGVVGMAWVGLFPESRLGD